jgi:hypothetical protein
MLMLASGQYVWHVSKLGNDSNDGRANAYPVDLAARSKLTIGAAIAVASAGDTILVWPGTYAEGITINKALHIIGQGNPGSVVIYNSAGKTITLSTNSSGTTIENIEARTDYDSAQALYCSTNDITDITLINCRLISTGQTGGTDFILWGGNGAKRIKLINCYGSSYYDGFTFSGSGLSDFLIENCVFEQTAVLAGGTSIRVTQGMTNLLVKNTRFYLTRPALMTLSPKTLDLTGTIARFENCQFTLEGSKPTTDASGSALLTPAYLATSRVVFEKCVFTNSLGTTNVYGLYASGSVVNLSDCSFNRAASPATKNSAASSQSSGHEKNRFVDSGGSTGNDTYNGWKLTWLTGANAGQSKYVYDYIGSTTKEFQFGTDFTNDIQVGDTYTCVAYTGGVVYAVSSSKLIINDTGLYQGSTDTINHIYADATSKVRVANSEYTATLVSGNAVDYLQPATFGRSVAVSDAGAVDSNIIKCNGSVVSAGAIPNAAAGSAGGLPTGDGNNRIAGIQGSVNNLNNLDAAVTSRLAAANYEPGETNPSVVLAAKMLVNKAVQDKQTGEIRYYDNDGETVLLTHTPQESEGQITRMPG